MRDRWMQAPGWAAIAVWVVASAACGQTAAGVGTDGSPAASDTAAEATASDAADQTTAADTAFADATPAGGDAATSADLDSHDAGAQEATDGDVQPSVDDVEPADADASADTAIADSSDGDLTDALLAEIADVAVIPDSLVDSVAADAGPAWLGPCAPNVAPLFGKVAAAKGFLVPGSSCASPGWLAPPLAATPTFSDVTAQVGLTKLAAVDGCILWEDLTGDNLPDLFVIEQPLTAGAKRYARLYELNGGAPWLLTSVPLPSDVQVRDCARIDWNHDGWTDVVLATDAGVRLLAGAANKLVDSTALLPAAAAAVPAWSVAVVDFDRDGDHDLVAARSAPLALKTGGYACAKADGIALQCCYGGAGFKADCLAQIKSKPIETYTCCQQLAFAATNLLLRNDGGSFVDISLVAKLPLPSATIAVAPFDIDRDGWPDLFTGTAFAAPSWQQNQADGTFAATAGPLGLRPYAVAAGCAIADLDHDGLVDLALTDHGAATLYRGKGAGGWQQDGDAGQLGPATADSVNWAVLAADFDNDGWRDLLVTRALVAKPGQLAAALQAGDPGPHLAAGSHLLLHNQGSHFVATALPWPKPTVHALVPVAAAATDFDGDGDLDLAVTSPAGDLRIWRNDAVKQHFLQLELAPAQSSAGGVGALVQVWVKGHLQERSVQWTAGPLTHGLFSQHIGLGTATQIDAIAVWWPSGKAQLLGPQAVDQVLAIFEDQATGSQSSDAGGSAVDAETLDSEVSTETIGISGIAPLALQNQPLAPFVEMTGQLPLPTQDTFKRMDCVLGLDLDGDNRDDLATIEQQVTGPGKTAYRFRVLLNKVNGWQVVVSPIDGTLYIPALGCFALDADADGKPDIAFGTLGSGIALYQNTGGAVFVDKTAAWLPQAEFDAWGGTSGDFDHDGDIEIFVGGGSVEGLCGGLSCNFVANDFWCKYGVAPTPKPAQQDHMFKRPNLQAKFVDATALFKLSGGGEATESAVIDIDRDGWVDLLVGNDFGDHYLLHNQNGKFVRFDAQIGFVGYAHHMGWGLGDFNGDGLADLVVADAGPALLYMGQTPTAGLPVLFSDKAKPSGIASATHDVVAWNPLVFDIDHDGDEDIWLPTSSIAPNGEIAKVGACSLPAKPAAQRDLILINDGKGSFATLLGPLPGNQQQAFAATPAVALDIDDDGDLDIAQVRRGGSIHVYRNDFANSASSGSSGGSVLLRLVGKGGNTTAAGAWATAQIAGKTTVRHLVANTGYGGSGLWRLHLGLGKASQIDKVVVHWPSGKNSSLGPVAAGSKLVVTEP